MGQRGGDDRRDVDNVNVYLTNRVSKFLSTPKSLFPALSFSPTSIYNTTHTKFYLRNDNDAGADVWFLTGGSYGQTHLMTGGVTKWNTSARGEFESFVRKWIEKSIPVSNYIKAERAKRKPTPTPDRSTYLFSVPADIWKNVADKVTEGLLWYTEELRPYHTSWGNPNTSRSEVDVYLSKHTLKGVLNEKDIKDFIREAHGTVDRNAGGLAASGIDYYWVNFKDSIPYRIKAFGNQPYLIEDTEAYQKAKKAWAVKVTKDVFSNSQKIKEFEKTLSAMRNDFLRQLTDVKSVVQSGEVELPQEDEKAFLRELNKQIVETSYTPPKDTKVDNKANEQIQKRLKAIELRLQDAEKRAEQKSSENSALGVKYEEISKRLNDTSVLLDLNSKELSQARNLSNEEKESIDKRFGALEKQVTKNEDLSKIKIREFEESLAENRDTLLKEFQAIRNNLTFLQEDARRGQKAYDLRFKKLNEQIDESNRRHEALQQDAKKSLFAKDDEIKELQKNHNATAKQLENELELTKVDNRKLRIKNEELNEELKFLRVNQSENAQDIGKNKHVLNKLRVQFDEKFLGLDEKFRLLEKQMASFIDTKDLEKFQEKHNTTAKQLENELELTKVDNRKLRIKNEELNEELKFLRVNQSENAQDIGENKHVLNKLRVQFNEKFLGLDEKFRLLEKQMASFIDTKDLEKFQEKHNTTAKQQVNKIQKGFYEEFGNIKERLEDLEYELRKNNETNDDKKVLERSERQRLHGRIEVWAEKHQKLEEQVLNQTTSLEAEKKKREKIYNAVERELIGYEARLRVLEGADIKHAVQIGNLSEQLKRNKEGFDASLLEGKQKLAQLNRVITDTKTGVSQAADWLKSENRKQYKELTEGQKKLYKDFEGRLNEQESRIGNKIEANGEKTIAELKENLAQQEMQRVLFDIYADNRKGLSVKDPNYRKAHKSIANIRIADMLFGEFFKKRLLANMLTTF